MFGPRHLHRVALMRRALRARHGSRVLDAACGLGQLASSLQRAGYRTFGIDGEFAAAMHVRANSSVPVVVGDVAQLPFRTAVFDAITSGETLEHLADDAGAAREIARALRKGGQFVATVPAFARLWTASDDYYEHRRRYAPKGLASLLEGAGFHVDRVSCWGFPMVLIYDYFVLLPLNRRRARGVGAATLAKAGRSHLLIGLVRAIFSTDRLFAWLPFGPGLIATATKPERAAN